MPEHLLWRQHARIHLSVKKAGFRDYTMPVPGLFCTRSTAFDCPKTKLCSQPGLSGSQSLQQVIQTSIPWAMNFSPKWQENIFEAGKKCCFKKEKALPQLWRAGGLPGWQSSGQRAADLTPQKLRFTWNREEILFHLGWEFEEPGG